MKRIVLLIATIIFSVVLLKAQQGIGVTNPDASSAFEISSTTKGLLIPRMTTVQMNAIASPANGLMIFNTTDSCVYIRRVSSWISTCSPTFAMSWGLLGNSGTTAGTNFVGTTDAQDLVFKTANTEGGRFNNGTGFTVAKHLSVGSGAAINAYQTANISENYTTVPAQTTIGLNINQIRTEAAPTASSIMYGVNSNVTYRMTGNATNGSGSGVNGSINSDGNYGFNTLIGGQFASTTQAASGTQNRIYGVYGYGSNQGTGTVNLISGTYGDATLSGGTVTDAYGASGFAFINGAGNITNAYGFRGNAAKNSGATGIITKGVGAEVSSVNALTNYGLQAIAYTSLAGTYTNTYGGTFDAYTSHASSTLTNAYGVKSTISKTAGTITNGYAGYFDATGGSTTNYGVYSTNNASATNNYLYYGLTYQTANTDWGLYITGEDKNYFSGSVGINTTTPQYKLDIDAQTGSAGNPLRLLGLNAGATSDSIISSNSGILRRLSINQILGNAWNITGNAGTVDGTNFIGTTDNIPFNIRVNNFKAGRIDHLNFNAFFGFMSGNANTGTRNSFFGHQAGSLNTTGSYNTGLGYGAMGASTTGVNNVSIGAGSMESNTTGSDNVAIGRHSMRKNITNEQNTAVGTYSLQENLGGYSNTALGWSALNQNTTGYLNVATGAQALIYNITGYENVASGFQSLYFNTAGNRNTSIGSYALFKNETGNNNVALGYSALGANITGWGNTALGFKAAGGSVGVTGTVAVGDSALLANTTGTGNTALGYQAGLTTQTGNNNTYLGYQADATSTALTNATAIGYNAKVAASNSLILGGTGANAVNVGMGTTTPLTKLDVVSSALTTTPTMNVTSTTAGINENIGTNYRTFAGAYFGYIGTAPSGSGGGQGPAIIAGADKSITFYTGASVAAPGNAWNPTSTENVPRMTILQFTGNTGIGTMTPQYKLDVDARTGSTGNPLRLLGLNAGATSDSIISSNSGVLRRLSVAQVLANAWNISGNSGTTAGTNFIGTTDAQGLAFKTNNTEWMRLNTSGYLGITTTTPAYKIHVEDPAGGDADIASRVYNTNVLTYQPSLMLQTSGGTKASPTAVASTTMLGVIRWGGYDGSAFNDVQCAEIGALATEAWTTSAHGTSLNFKTIPNANTTALSRLFIDQNGYTGIGTMTPNQQLEITAAMRMPATTTSTTGVIYKGANRFIHDYKPSANDGNNTFVGVNAGNFTMSSATSWLASGNTGVGTNALTANTAGGFNTAISLNAMTANTTGAYNLGVGSYALAANTTGQGNTAVGHNTLTLATSNNNTAVGNATLYNTTTGTANTGVGDSNLNKNTTGNYNTAVGQSTMRENTTGASNSALGLSALQANTTGSFNTAVGVSSLVGNVVGNNNTGVGFDALVATTSSNNTGLGYLAGVGNTTGANNTFVGYNTGATNSTGSNNTLLGYQANVSSAALINATAIGNGATVNGNNKIRLGNGSVTLVETFGSFVTISDRRLKTNITDNYIGLNFIKAVRPVNYELKSQKGIVYDGFVAQEIDSILSKQGIKTFSGLSKPENTEGGYYTVSYATFVVPLVNAVKELDANNEKLKAKNEKLENELERLKAENAALKASTDKNSKDIESIKAQLGIKN